MSEFPIVEIGTVARIQSGFSFKSSDWKVDGIPVVKIANVKNGRVDRDGLGYVDEQVAEQATKFSLLAGDVLLAMTGYVGEVAVVREWDLPLLLNQRVGRCEPTSTDVDKSFLYYSLSSGDARRQLENLVQGSAQPNLSARDFGSVEVHLPPLAEQRAIAGVLGALDDKIESNRRVHEIIDQYLTIEYLGRHHPNWVSVRLGDYVDLLPGKYLEKTHYGESGTYPVLGSNSEMGWTETPLYDGELICLARIGSNFGAVRLCLNGAWVNNNASAIRAKPGFDLLSAFYFLKTFDFGSIRRGSSQPFLAHEDVANLELRLPLTKDRDKLKEWGHGLSRRAEQAQQESRALRKLRDALLPELLSGRIRIQDLEKVIEGAL